MNRLYPAPPSGLPRQQPQRYSDRHRLYVNPRSTFMSASPHAAAYPDDSSNDTPLDKSDDEDARDTAPDIRSYLKKTGSGDRSNTPKLASMRVAAPETDIEASELKRAKKPGLSTVEKTDQ